MNPKEIDQKKILIQIKTRIGAEHDLDQWKSLGGGRDQGIDPLVAQCLARKRGALTEVEIKIQMDVIKRVDGEKKKKSGKIHFSPNQTLCTKTN